MGKASSVLGIKGWAVSGALALAVTLTTAPVHSQVVDKPDANLPAVQDADLGPDARAPYDGRIEVQLTPRTQKALTQGGGWDALQDVNLVYDGKQPIEATVHYAVVDRDGKVLESRGSSRVKLEGRHSKVGAAKELDFLRERIGALSSSDDGIIAETVPAAAFSPNETYFPDPANWVPDRAFWPGSEWDARHTVTDPDNMDRKRAGEDSGKEWKARGPGVFTDSFLVVTVVPTDPDARGQVEVRPLIVDLDGPTGPE